MRNDLLGLTHIQAFNFDKVRLLQALEGQPVYERTADGIKYTYPSKDERRKIILSIFDNAVDTALDALKDSCAYERTLAANGHPITDRQVLQDYLHYRVIETKQNNKGEQYIFGDPDKPEKKTEETTHNPG